MKKNKGSYAEEIDVFRAPVSFDYTGLNPEFLKCMAEICPYADAKYGSWDQYTKGELTGSKSPINHAIEHLMQFQRGEPYDHFDHDVRRHLVAAAYNCMMSFYYAAKFGRKAHPLTGEVITRERAEVGFVRVSRRRKAKR